MLAAAPVGTELRAQDVAGRALSPAQHKSLTADHEAVRRRPAEGSFRLLELGGRKVRWTLPANGLPTTVTYAFVTQPMQFAGARNCDAMTTPEAALSRSHLRFEDFRREVHAAFAAWEQAANIVFRETASVAEAGILIGADAKPRGRAFTNVALRDETGARDSTSMGAIRQSLICFNPQKPWKIGFDGNLDVYDVRYMVMHEIGHAIGLDHPSPQGQLMSFRYVEAARGLQPGDMAGAAALYGPRGAAGAAPGALPPLRADAVGLPQRFADRTFGLGEPGATDEAR